MLLDVMMVEPREVTSKKSTVYVAVMVVQAPCTEEHVYVAPQERVVSSRSNFASGRK